MYVAKKAKIIHKKCLSNKMYVYEHKSSIELIILKIFWEWGFGLGVVFSFSETLGISSWIYRLF
jgi:hypothetical protein